MINMIRFLIVLNFLLTVPAFIVSADKITDSGAVTEEIPLLLWAATDPSEDSEVGKIDAAKFYHFTEKHREEFIKYHDNLNIIGVTKFLKDNAEESGTSGVNWITVFTKILAKSLTFQTEKDEHGLPSLVAWAVRNTGPGTKLTSVDRETLVSFLLSHKSNISNYLIRGNVDGLIKYLDSTKTISTSKNVDWKTVINDLKNNRQLFKSPCRLLKLILCDNTQQ